MRTLPILPILLRQVLRRLDQPGALLAALLAGMRKLFVPGLLLTSSSMVCLSLKGSWQDDYRPLLWGTCLLVSLVCKFLLENERPALPAVVHIQPGQNRIIPYYLLLELLRLCNLNLLLLMAPFQAEGMTGLSGSTFIVSALLLSILGTYLVLVMKRSRAIGRWSLSYIRLYKRPDYGIRMREESLRSTRSGLSMYLLRQTMRTKMRNSLPVLIFFPCYAIWMQYQSYSDFENRIFCLIPATMPLLFLEMGFSPESVSADGLMLQPGQPLKRILMRRLGICMGASLGFLLLGCCFVSSDQRWGLFCQGIFLITLLAHAFLPNAAFQAKRVDYKHDTNTLTYNLYTLVDLGAMVAGGALIFFLQRYPWGNSVLLSIGGVLLCLLELNARLCYQHFYRNRHTRLAAFRTTLK